jgi:hypothetical protein
MLAMAFVTKKVKKDEAKFNTTPMPNVDRTLLMKDTTRVISLLYHRDIGDPCQENHRGGYFRESKKRLPLCKTSGVE